MRWKKWKRCETKTLSEKTPETWMDVQKQRKLEAFSASLCSCVSVCLCHHDRPPTAGNPKELHPQCCSQGLHPLTDGAKGCPVHSLSASLTPTLPSHPSSPICTKTNCKSNTCWCMSLHQLSGLTFSCISVTATWQKTCTMRSLQESATNWFVPVWCPVSRWCFTVLLSGYFYIWN